ncbi:hypothetical protein CTI12_AA214720 [Artemisia annua]|uniref:Uncharacterized protein n=1 Tax=Artemisia annua TaxID=35608 RepID=A0A2U1NYE4_ARTAN|nr:hypothetical protein CTI12_AA214720 [Artemisia annua]
MGKRDMLAVGVTENDMTKDAASKFKNPILKKLDYSNDGGFDCFKYPSRKISPRKHRAAQLSWLPGPWPQTGRLFWLGKYTTGPLLSLSEVLARKEAFVNSLQLITVAIEVNRRGTVVTIHQFRMCNKARGVCTRIPSILGAKAFR